MAGAACWFWRARRSATSRAGSSAAGRWRSSTPPSGASSKSQGAVWGAGGGLGVGGGGGRGGGGAGGAGGGEARATETQLAVSIAFSARGLNGKRCGSVERQAHWEGGLGLLKRGVTPPGGVCWHHWAAAWVAGGPRGGGASTALAAENAVHRASLSAARAAAGTGCASGCCEGGCSGDAVRACGARPPPLGIGAGLAGLSRATGLDPVV